MGLFKKKGDKSPAPQAANPYAQPPPNPYQQAKAQAYNPPAPTGQGPPPPAYSANGRGGSGYDGDKKHPYDNGYGQQDRAGGGYGGGGYNANPYGGQGGYGGGDRYGASQKPQAPPGGGSRYGAGGYGGMGGADPYAKKEPDDASRNALFANPNQGKPPADLPPQQGGYGGAPNKSNPYDPANPHDGGFDSTGGYAPGPAYQDRQLTAEEEEEQEVNNTKNEIRQIKREDVSSTRNALRMANRAEEIGRDTLARLGAQGEMIHNTEKNLDLAHNHNKIAEDHARELKTLNRSMFAVHVSNPFTSKSRREAQEQAVIDRHLEERGQREETRRAAYLADQRMQSNFKDLEKAGGQQQQRKERNLAERAKYQFEADSEDEDMENEIDSNLDALSGAAGRLNALAKATGKEVDAQNGVLDRLRDKSDRVDVGLASNHARINQISKRG